MADENDEMKSDAGDPGETMQMPGSSGAEMDEPKKEKKPGDWVTVEMPKVPKAATQPKAPATPPPASTPPPSAVPEAERTVLEGASSEPKGPAPSMPASAPQGTPGGSSSFSGNQPEMVSTPPMQSAPQEGMAWMASLGIKDPGTQKIVLGVVGGLIFLCCACSCLGLLVPMFLNGSASSF